MQTILCSEVASSITDIYQQTQEEKHHIFEENDIAKFSKNSRNLFQTL